MAEARFDYLPKKAVYLDYNATTPVDVRVMGVYERMCRDTWANPSSLHVCGYNAWDSIQLARGELGEFFGCDYRGFRFCSSGSEALHAGMAGVLSKNPGTPVVTGATEHSAVRHLLRIRKLQGEPVELIRVDGSGIIDLEELKTVIGKNHRPLVILSPVNHETGTLQPVREINALVKTGDGTLFFDGVQAASRLHPESWVPWCDMFCISGHKLYAPKGIAALWIREGLKVHPFRFGGCQERGLFPGTENTPGIAALAETIRLMKEEFSGEIERLKVLSEEAVRILESCRFPFHLESPENRAPGVLCISLPWIKDMQGVMYTLSRENICISRFSACSSRVDGPSRILVLMGREKKRAETSLRISLGKFSRRDDIFSLKEVLTDLYNREAAVG